MDKLLSNLKKGVSIAAAEAERLTKVVADKTVNIVDTTKLNISLNEAEKKITALYTQIGETVYKKYLGDEPIPGGTSGICLQIDDLNDEINEIKTQIAELKSSAICSKCGESIAKDSGYCSKCGAKLFEDRQNNADMVIEVTNFPED